MDITSYLIGKKNGGITPTGEISITNNGITNVSDYATANVNVQPTLQDKEVEITENGEQTITADENYDGLNSVSITTNVSGGDVSEYFSNELTKYTGTNTPWASLIKKLPNTMLTISGEDLMYGFRNWCFDFEPPMIDTSNITSLNGLFNNDNSNINNLTKINNVENYNVGKCILFSSMFYRCGKLKKIDLSKWNINTNAKSFSSIFGYCYNLEEVDFSSIGEINASNFNLSSMFDYCNNIKKINLSNMKCNTDNINCTYMFRNCYKLNELDMSNFDFSKIGSTNYMFTNVPVSCLIYVKDQDQVDWFNSNFKSYTNVQIKGA